MSFTWSSETKTSIASRTLRQFLSTHTWFDFERGLLSQEVCYERVGAEFSLDPAEIRKAFDETRDSLQCNDALISMQDS
jgi:hypothetical protein